jgi:hypothetical protein
MHNRILLTAITAALSISHSGITQAAPASLTNATGTVIADCANVAANGCPIIGTATPAWGVANATLGGGIVNAQAGNEDKGIIYAAELFGSGTVDLPSGNGLTASSEEKGTRQAVVYNVNGDITQAFLATFTLSDGALFVNEPQLSVADAGANAVHNDLVVPSDTGQETASGKSTAAFAIDAKTGVLTTDDKIALIFQWKDANRKLATAGESIEMSVTLETDGLQIPVNPPRSVPIATSKQCITAAIKSESLGTVKISVSDDSKKFSGENPPGGVGAFISDSQALLGYVEISDQRSVTTASERARTSNGVEECNIGQFTDTKVNTDTTLLQITDGQFAASHTPPSGDVFLIGVKSGGGAALGTTSADATLATDTEATWKLNDTTLDNIATDTNDSTAAVNIQFKVDGNTEINLPENDPVASFTIDFVQDYMADITLDPPVTLRKFRPDGATCILYNIPNSVSAPDTVTVRITNPTSSEGLLKAQMWGQDGSELIPSGTLLNDGNNIKAYETVVVPATALEDLAGGAWNARGVLKVTSTVPKLEMFGMLRDKATGIVTNLSAGATGSGCTF